MRAWLVIGLVLAVVGCRKKTMSENGILFDDKSAASWVKTLEEQVAEPNVEGAARWCMEPDWEAFAKDQPKHHANAIKLCETAWLDNFEIIVKRAEEEGKRSMACHIDMDVRAARRSVSDLPAAKPLLDRHAAACAKETGTGSAVAVEPDEPATPQHEALAKSVQAEMATIKAALESKEPALADVGCVRIIGDLDELKTSKNTPMKEVWATAHVLCNYTSPLRVLTFNTENAEAARKAKPTGAIPECKVDLSYNAFMLLAVNRKLEDDTVKPVLARWTAACPTSVLEPK